MGRITVGRVYDERGPGDGVRVLVDRLWPRGLRRDAGAFDEWPREIAPSDELRTWFGHDPARWAEFTARYRDELDTEDRRAALARLRTLAADGPLTLVTATRDVARSHAAVLADSLREPPPDRGDHPGTV